MTDQERVAPAEDVGSAQDIQASMEDAQIQEANLEAGRRLGDGVMVLRFSMPGYPKTKQVSGKDREIAEELGIKDPKRVRAIKALWAKDERFNLLHAIMSEASRVVNDRTWQRPARKGERLVPPGDPEARREAVEMALEGIEDDRYRERIESNPDLMEQFRQEALTSLHPRLFQRIAPVQYIHRELSRLAGDLVVEVARFNREDYQTILEENRKALGPQFNPADYPLELNPRIIHEWESPEPRDDWTARFGVGFGTQQAQWFQDEMATVVERGKQDFLGAMHKVTDHLIERLQGVNAKGNFKQFNNSTVENIRKELEYFQGMLEPIGGRDQRIEQVFDQFNLLLSNVGAPENLKCSANATPRVRAQVTEFRSRIATQGRELAQTLEGFMVDKPKRKITRGASL
jgi:hypothetical protein